MLLNPCITSIPVTIATLIMSPFDNNRGGWGNKGWLVSTKLVMLSTWLLKSFFYVTLWWTFTWNINIFTLFDHSERSIHIPLPKCSLSSIFQSRMRSFTRIGPCRQPDLRFPNVRTVRTKLCVFFYKQPKQTKPKETKISGFTIHF